MLVIILWLTDQTKQFHSSFNSWFSLLFSMQGGKWGRWPLRVTNMNEAKDQWVLTKWKFIVAPVWHPPPPPKLPMLSCAYLHSLVFINAEFMLWLLCRSVQRSNCYMVCVADAVTPSSSSRSSSDLEIGCLADLATGLVSFTANGKELPTSYQVSKYNRYQLAEDWSTRFGS